MPISAFQYLDYKEQALSISPHRFNAALEQVRKALYEKDFHKFVQAAWPIIEPSTVFHNNWHVEVICEHLEALTRREIQRCIFNVPPGFMKALDSDTPVLTTWGIKRHGDIRKGDFVFGPDGQPKRVLGCTEEQQEESYCVEFDDHSTIIAGAGHLWEVERDNLESKKKFNRERVKAIVTTTELRGSGYRRGKSEQRPDRILVAEPPQFPPKRLLIDPYVLGAWLGDGTTLSGIISSAEQDIAHFATLGRISAVFEPDGSRRMQRFYRILIPGLQTKLRIMDLLGNKHIPEDYLESSIDQRWSLLQGLMDTDGTCHVKSGGCHYTTVLPNLADQVVRLVASLGMKAFKSQRFTKLNGKVYGPHYKISFMPSAGATVFRLKRKQERVTGPMNPRSRYRYVISVTPVGKRTVKCLHVEDHLYLAGNDLIPTHNSILVSVMWPVWHWIHFPGDRILSASFKQDLANRDAGRSKDILKSEWFQLLWGQQVAIRKGKDLTELYWNTKTGWRKAVNVGGGTGDRAQVRIVDDAHNIHEAESDTIREGVIDWIKDTWFQRGADIYRDLDVWIMQRTHARDACGFLMEEVGGYVEVVLPMEFEPNRCFVSVLEKPKHPRDKRTQKGELLDPIRVPQAEVELRKRVLGAYRASGQLQQRPAPEEGGMFKKFWWRVWHYPGKPLPDYELVDANGTVHVLKCIPLPHSFDREVQSWDCTFEKGELNDYVAGQHWGKKDALSFLLDYVLAKMDFNTNVRQIKQMNAKFIQPGKILVERAANGWAIVSSLQSHIPGIVGVPTTKDSKPTRAQAYSPIVEAGQCILPHPSISPHTLSFIENMSVFPNGVHDDDTDAWSQGMNELYGKSKNLVPILTEFEENAHLSRNPVKPVQGLRAFRFWFGGVYPTCIIGQVTRKGGIIIFHCLQAEGMGMEEFIRMRVMSILNQDYPWILDWTDIGPPSMMMKTNDPVQLEYPGMVVERVLGTTFTMGHKDFSSRVQVSKEILRRLGGVLINCERTQGEVGHHLLMAIQSDYGFELDPITQYVKRETPFMAIPGYAVGEALTTGLAHFYGEPNKPYQKPFDKKKMVKRAESYSVS